MIGSVVVTFDSKKLGSKLDPEQKDVQPYLPDISAMQIRPVRSISLQLNGDAGHNSGSCWQAWMRLSHSQVTIPQTKGSCR